MQWCPNFFSFTIYIQQSLSVQLVSELVSDHMPLSMDLVTIRNNVVTSE
jgi:hypothetical protein